MRRPLDAPLTPSRHGPSAGWAELLPRFLRPLGFGPGPGSPSWMTPFFRAVSFPEDRAEELRGLAARGTLVYIMRSAGAVNLSYFNHAYGLRGIPRAGLVHGLSGGLWRAGGYVPATSVDARGLADGILRGESALIFLRQPEVFGPRGGAAPTEDPFPELVRRVRESGHKVFLVPQVLIWERTPGRLKGGLVEAVLGAPDSPNPLRTAGAFLYNYRHAFAKVGQAIDLLSFCEAQREAATDRQVARKVRGALWQHLAREARGVTGPRLKSGPRLIEEVMRDRTLRASMERIEKDEAAPGARTEGKRAKGADLPIEARARAALAEIAAHYSPATVEVIKPTLDLIFNRIYDGIEVDREGIERIRRASAHASLVLCPSHKSHIDYLILPVVLYDAGMTPPHVAAGANLAFFPLGALFRRAGAFFLRRSFKGDKLYGAVFRAYVKRLMHDGFMQEFFIEGSRSRTGKLLTPKLGLLSMEVDAWFEGACRDVSFVPIAIDYEKVLEGGAYASELAGGEKQKEDVRGLLRTPKVLRSRYGRIYLQVEEPIALRDFCRERGVDPDHHTDEQRRSLVQLLAHRIVYGISRAATVTPAGLVAAALLAHRRRGLSSRELSQRIEFLRNAAESVGARLSRVLYEASSDPMADGPIRSVIDLFTGDGSLKERSASGETFFTAVEERRPHLCFYKNSLVQHYVAPALFATALLSFREGAPPLAAVRERTLWLSRLFKFEFVYRVGQSFEQIFEETQSRCASLGLIEPPRPEAVRPASIAARERLELLRDLIRDFLESYWIAIDALQDLETVPELESRELVRRALERGRAAFMAGRLTQAEAVSRPAIENALLYAREAGLLEPVGEKKVRLPQPLREDSTPLRKTALELERYL